MFTRKIIVAVVFLFSLSAAFAQTPEKEKPKTVTDELRKEAVEFLRETSAEVGNLRSLENRIGFSSEMASLMWFYDSKQASVMYGAVITDFKQLLADYNAQMAAMSFTPDENQNRMNMFIGDESDKARLSQKVFKAMGVRQQIAMSLAEHEPSLAYDFYFETIGIITNAEFRKKLEQRDMYFETQLLQRIAEKDPAKAIEFGRKSLAKGVNWAHADLLQKIYDKDAEKGAEFAAEVVSKFKTDKNAEGNSVKVRPFLTMGDANAETIKKKDGKKPMFTRQELRDLAEIMAQGILENKKSSDYEVMVYGGESLTLIEKYAPARALQIRAKFPDRFKPKTPVATETAEVVGLKPPPMTREQADAELKETEATKEQKAQEEMMENVKKLGTKELPKEEREKIVGQSRKIIGGLGSRTEKLVALNLLAGQVSKLGDKELAADIMKDAQTLVNPSPKNFRDYIEVWTLASAYAETDPEKAFPILDDAIFRLNDTLAAFIKVGEFIDVSGEMIDDGEVQLSAFGGSMINGVTRELGIANATVRNLAIADFGKTKALTNKFDRTEVRILAKMLILRAVLGGEERKVKIEDAELTTVEN